MNIERSEPTKHGAFSFAPRPDSHQLRGPAPAPSVTSYGRDRVFCLEASCVQSQGSTDVLTEKAPPASDHAVLVQRTSSKMLAAGG